MKILSLKWWKIQSSLLRSPKDIWWYIQGTVRTFCYEHASWLIRRHIMEQFEYRKIKAIKCSLNGSCVFCHCLTPDLFFANKPCSLTELTSKNRILLYNQEEPCYGPMLTKLKWNKKIKK
jgi:hypothetical protein